MSSTVAAPLTPTAVSCPAKVLVAGGYLVLDRDYSGLVFGLDARIHTVVEPIKTKDGVSISEILVTSPQFREAIWEYGYRLQGEDAGIKVTQLSIGHEQSIPTSRNPFIETALTYALTYIQKLHPTRRIEASSIRILADQAYYSNPGKPKPKNIDFLPEQTSRFKDFDVKLKDAHKTGLGSSAALVASFTAAVLSFYLPRNVFDLRTERGLRILHNLAQASHSYAQGKVGSGFDIASAVYGSCLYKRFSPSLLTSLPPPNNPGFSTKLADLVEGDAWDTEIQKAAIKMPKGLRLVMCDVDCGSETPTMVKRVLAWREANKGYADQIWKDLQAGNEALAAEITRLAELDRHVTSLEHNKLGEIIAQNRALIRQMGEASGVPIEPAPQTRLLDYCTDLHGVIGGVVPGAGGYDAIVLFVEDWPDNMAGLSDGLAKYRDEKKNTSGGMSELTIGRVGIIQVREEMQGVKEEDISLYSEWESNKEE